MAEDAPAPAINERLITSALTPREIGNVLRDGILTGLRAPNATSASIAEAFVAASQQVDPNMPPADLAELREKAKPLGDLFFGLKQASSNNLPQLEARITEMFGRDYENALTEAGVDPNKPSNQQQEALRNLTNRPRRMPGTTPPTTTPPPPATGSGMPYGGMGGAAVGLIAATALDVGNWTSFTGILKKLAIIGAGVGIGMAVTDDFGVRTSVVNAVSGNRATTASRT